MTNECGASGHTTLDLIIVGAGFAGIYALHKFRKLGMKVRILEAGSGVGGVWYWNRYPGARCDVESIDYSYSFDEALQQDWTWSEKYAAQPEIRAYLEHVVDRFDLRSDIQLDTWVETVRFDNETERWTALTAEGERFVATYVIMATGPLSAPIKPSIPGLDNFEGPIYYTSSWPDQKVDFAGKRVGLIGTGSSGVQTTPVVAAEADHLYVFQRSANYSVPARNAPLSAERMAEVKTNYPRLREAQRNSPVGNAWSANANPRGVFDYDPTEREAECERAWEKGGAAFLVTFSDMLVKPEANAVISEFVRRKIKEIVKDPATAASLTPPEALPLGCKRICVDTGYFDTFNRPNVSLVDLRENPIETVTADGIRTSDQNYLLDAIILATGFDAMTGALMRIDIRGRDGIALRDKWADGPITFLGLAAKGFPNLFFINGPGSPSVTSNVVMTSELQTDWIGRLMDAMKAKGSYLVEPEAEAETAWAVRVNDIAQQTIFTAGCDSWFIGSNIPGKPRLFTAFAGGMNAYFALCNEVEAKDYEGFDFISKKVEACQ